MDWLFKIRSLRSVELGLLDMKGWFEGKPATGDHVIRAGLEMRKLKKWEAWINERLEER